MNRRTFLAQTAAVTALAHAKAATPATSIVDVNCQIGRWPFRELRQATASALAARLKQQGVATAWVGAFEGVLHRDLTAVNARLSEECRRDGDGILIPVGAINLTLPGWRDDVDRCKNQHGMKIVRLHPNYHAYALDDPRCRELIALCAEQGLVVQIAAQMEDQRTQNAVMQVKPVDLRPLPALLKTDPEARVMVLNANARMITAELAGAKDIWLDFAMLEGVGGLENLLKSWPAERLCFGSLAPLFYWESAKLKMQESELTESQAQAIRQANALELLG